MMHLRNPKLSKPAAVKREEIEADIAGDRWRFWLEARVVSTAVGLGVFATKRLKAGPCVLQYQGRSRSKKDGYEVDRSWNGCWPSTA